MNFLKGGYMFGIQKDPNFIIKKSIRLARELDKLEEKKQETIKKINDKKQDLTATLSGILMIGIIMVFVIIHHSLPVVKNFFSDIPIVMVAFLVFGVSFFIAESTYRFLKKVITYLNKRHIAKEELKLLKIESKIKNLIREEKFYFQKPENQGLVLDILNTHKPEYDNPKSVIHNQRYIEIKSLLDSNNYIEAFKIFGNYCENNNFKFN